jgi:hypothetical protein
VGVHVRITVRGRLSDRFASAFDGMAVEPGAGETSFVGELRDQGELYDVLERVRNLGLELVRVDTSGSGSDESSALD